MRTHRKKKHPKRAQVNQTRNSPIRITVSRIKQKQKQQHQHQHQHRTKYRSTLKNLQK